MNPHSDHVTTQKMPKRCRRCKHAVACCSVQPFKVKLSHSDCKTSIQMFHLRLYSCGETHVQNDEPNDKPNGFYPLPFWIKRRAFRGGWLSLSLGPAIRCRYLRHVQDIGGMHVHFIGLLPIVDLRNGGSTRHTLQSLKGAGLKEGLATCR